MSRYYSMYVSIKDCRQEHVDAIKKAAENEWNFSNWEEFEGQLTADENGSLVGGETEGEFADRLAKSIWQANEGFCPVEVQATCLEELPHENYCFDEDDFFRLTGKQVQPTDQT